MRPVRSAEGLALLSLVPLAAAFLLVLACGPIPGGRLSGELKAPPADWTPVAEGFGICEIESRPGDPHSVQLQCYAIDAQLYVHSHRWALSESYPFESWAAIWLEHPNVRVRFGDSIYELEAARVTDPALRESVLSSRGYDPVPDGIVLFNLRPRSPG